MIFQLRYRTLDLNFGKGLDVNIKYSDKYNIETISLSDFLDSHDVIDYLSIDSEGNKYDILKAFLLELEDAI